MAATKKEKLHIDLRNLPEIVNRSFYPLLTNKSRYLVLKGGGSSGKSVFVGQKLIFRALADKEGGHRFLIVRKIKQDLRDSAFAQLVRTIRSWGMEDLFYIPSGRSSDLYLRCELNGNEFLFVGLDDIERLKSIEGITDVWVEEASEISPEEFRQLDIRMRAQSKYYKQMILSFNPISITHWLKAEFFDKKKPDSTVHESTYKDNRFLAEEDKLVLESFKDTDEYYYTVYCLGEWGVTGKTVYDAMVVTQRLLEVRNKKPLAVGRMFYKLNEAEKVIAGSVEFVPDVNGNLKIYEWPMGGYPYVIGGDTAEGGKDWCTGSVRNNISWNQAAMYRDRLATDLYAKDMFALGTYYNTALIGIESNFDSHPMKELSSHRYPKQYVRQQLEKIGEDVVEKFGWRSDKVSRPLLVGEHVELAREHIETFNDADLLDEMLTFVRNEKGRAEAQGGAHDDTIIADGIALQIRDQQTFRIVQPPPEKKFLHWALRTDDGDEALSGARAWKKW